MKKSEFRKLIREEIRKVLKEAISPKVYYFEYYAHQSGTITTGLQTEYNKIVSEGLTEQILVNKFIDKWDGKAPLYGNTPVTFMKSVK